MKKKICFKCKNKKELRLFYKHPKTADKHLNKCKLCTKKDVKKRYENPIFRKRIEKYESERFKRPERKEQLARYRKEKNKKFPNKYRARTKLNHAVRDGHIERLPCEKCGEPKSDGHHRDYRKPLDVKWLCRRCHYIEHGKKLYKLK